MLRRRRPAIRKFSCAARRAATWTIEALESRILLSSVTWTGAGGDNQWTTPGNWSTNALPGPVDDVTINLAGNAGVQLASGQQVIHSLVSNNPLLVSGGELDVATTAALSAGLTLNNATLSGGDYSTAAGGSLTATGGTLQGVTLDCDLSLPDNGKLSVVNGLTLNGTMTLTRTGYTSQTLVTFTGGGTLGGSGRVVFVNQGQYGGLDPVSEGILPKGGTLTIGPSIIVHGQRGTVGDPTLPLVNQGTIDADAGSIGVVGSTVTNQGTLKATGGGVSIGGSWKNLGTLSASNGGQLALDGTFRTADIGTLTDSGGSVVLTGILDNSNATLSLDAATGSVGLYGGGTIRGGTVVTSGGSSLDLVNTALNPATLDAVTLDCDLSLPDNGKLSVVNGLTLNGTMTLTRTGYTSQTLVTFTGGGTLGGSGRVVFVNQGQYGGLDPVSEGILPKGGTLTIGPSIIVHGQRGTVGDPTLPLVNQGTIDADAGSIGVVGSTVTNQGTLEATGGGNLGLPNGISGGSGILRSTPASSVGLSGNFFSASTAAQLFQPLGITVFNGNGSAASPQLLQGMSNDSGPDAAGFSNNFDFGTISLANGTYVKLIQTQAAASSPAVYANELIVSAGCTLNLNGQHLYARAVQIDPAATVIGGAVTPVPHTEQLSFATPIAGLVAVGAVDQWQFFGRAGRSVTVIVNPTGSVSPALGSADMAIAGPDGTVLNAATSASLGATVTLSSVTLPLDGTYSISVRPSSSPQGQTGNYVISVYDVTPVVGNLTVNQTVTGNISSPFVVNQWNFAAQSSDQIRFNLLNASGPGLLFTLLGPNGYSGFTDLTISSDPITLPATGIYTLVAHGAGDQTGSYAFRVDQSAVTDLTLDSPYTGTLAGSGQAILFRVRVASTQALSMLFTDSTPADGDEVYASFGTPPTRTNHDYRFTPAGTPIRFLLGSGGSSGLVPATSSQASLLIPSAAPGTWYVLVYASSVQAPSSFRIAAAGTPLKLTALTPDHTGRLYEYGFLGNLENVGDFSATLYISGAGFQFGTTVALVGSDGKSYPAASVAVDSASQLRADFFDKGGPTGGSLPLGKYSVRVTRPDGATDTLPDAFRVDQVPDFPFLPQKNWLNTQLFVPASLGRHSPAILYVSATNVSEFPHPAPLLVLSSSDPAQKPLMTLDASRVTQGFWTSAIPDGFSNAVSIMASGRTPGVLQPGESIQVPVYWGGLQQPWSSHTTVPFNLDVTATDDATPIDWIAFASSLQPTWLSPAAWAPIFADVIAQAGSTAGGYVKLLDDNAQFLGRLGESVTDVSRLWEFAIQQANGLTTLPQLASSTDASLPVPGALSLSFGRSFGEPINSRYQFGLLGYGWSVPWQQSVQVAPDGTVIYNDGSGMLHYYQPDSRNPGHYFSEAGDMTMLMGGPSGTFMLEAPSGQITGFRADGKLDYVQDTNGNKITAAYNAPGQLVSLTYSSGESLTFTYNPAGLIASVTDSDDRVTSYAYDSNQQLMEVDSPQGLTKYTYSNGNGAAAEHALLSIQNPDGMHQYFTYDSMGRLSGTSRDGAAEQLTFSYDQPGEVTAIDANQNASKTFFNELGLIAKTQDALGDITSYAYDQNLMLTSTTDTTGQVQAYTYDPMGNVTSSTDQLHNTTRFTYGAFNRLTSVTDGNGNTTRYNYDAAGNLLSITYPDQSQQRYAYDPLGNATSYINRRGQPIGYKYNAAGQVTEEDLADGTKNTYSYDSHGNLIGMTDSTGQTTFSYDAADHLTEVDYPGGLFLKFTYDSGGRRIKMVDQTGFTVNYAYDAVGRLSKLTDGTGNLIVVYTYDAAGNLSRKDNGNGTYTTYQYDADGNVLHLINYGLGGSVNSRFDYAYNSLGQETTEATIDGTWTYSYDSTGQLTHAVFAPNSSNPDLVTPQDLTYVYDPVGNRIKTIENGVTTAYTVNNLNEYTSVGGVPYTYDLDGNLTSDGTNGYSYNALNQLTGVTNAQGNWEYTYDGQGSRVASLENGQPTQYEIDPAGLGNVVGTFDGVGAAVAHYLYGLGLTNQIAAAGATAFYDFDSLGSTAGLSGASATYMDRYSYLPFGQTTTSAAAIQNPSQFAGQFGVMADAPSFEFMRSRFYDPLTGQFASNDPLGLSAGDPNIRRYVRNQPTDLVDPTGLLCIINGSFQNGGPSNFFGLSSGASFGFSAGVSLGASAGYGAQAGFGPGGVVVGGNVGIAHAGVGWYAGAGLSVGAGYGSSVGYSFGYSQGSSYGSGLGIGWGDKCPPPPPPPMPPPPDGSGGGSGSSGIPNVQDPNLKLGPSGFGPLGFISGGALLPYRIDFENDPSATAPAQQVVITDQLDMKLDWSTFQLTQVGFGDTNITVPADSQHFETTVPITENGQNFVVQIDAGIDLATGLFTVRFQSVNPNTGLPPDVLTGFLPPENGTGRGMGYVSYTVLPKAGLATGTQIRNVADISFDGQPIITTDQVNDEDPGKGVDPTKQDLNTIDSGAPTSSVAALPATERTASFPVSWSGQDDAGGSGVNHYDIYVSTDDGPFTLWLGNTTQTSAAYLGAEGRSYGFYSVATDNVSNVQATPMAAQASTKVMLIPGDADGDGKVDFADLVIVARNYGKSNATFAMGDFNGDGMVGFDDLVIVARNYGSTVLTTGVPTALASGGPAALGASVSDNPLSLVLRLRKRR